MELTPLDADAASRYKKIVADPEGMDDLLVDLFLEAYDNPPAEIIVDVDATDDPLHGNQEGRFFHGYYRSYCYLPRLGRRGQLPTRGSYRSGRAQFGHPAPRSMASLHAGRYCEQHAVGGVDNVRSAGQTESRASVCATSGG